MIAIHSNAKNIKTLLTNENKQFLIPDYQRPYAWQVEHCKTLWEDLMDFAFPDGDKKSFDAEKDRYFLGDVTFFQNYSGQNEIIDGQQRIVTVTLLLRAFYEHFQKSSSEAAQNISKDIENCLWLTDELGNKDLNRLKVTSDFLEKQENALFKSLLTTGVVKYDAKDNFSKNYNFFRSAIKDCGLSANDFALFSARILKNCYVVQIETSTQDEALKVFTSVNDRGLPLSTTDIFRSVLYKKFRDIGEVEKQQFIGDWDKLSKISRQIFPQTTKITPMEGLLMCYVKNFSDFQSSRSLKKIFEKNNYERLRSDNFIPDLFDLTGFWQDVYTQNIMQFSDEVLRKIFTLLRIASCKPMLSLSGLYFYLREENKVNDNKLLEHLLGKFTACIIARSIQGEIGNGVKHHWDKTEWADLDKKTDEVLNKFKLHKSSVEMLFRNFAEARNKTFVKQAVLSYWFFHFDNQELPPPKDKFSIEHIVAKDSENFKKFNNPDLLESLGNMAFLENRINTRANNLGFDSKKICYVGFTDKGKHSPGTVNRELQHLAQTYNDFTETDIRNRNEKMLDTVLTLLGKYNLLKDR